MLYVVVNMTPIDLAHREPAEVKDQCLVVTMQTFRPNQRAEAEKLVEIYRVAFRGMNLVHSIEVIEDKGSHSAFEGLNIPGRRVIQLAS